ncbi:hypothetical protein BC940DRAFT_308646 [Gongronella butleri]|nr:hypothetical protein BC940DRAFT_308646 [Gongronella butleri]
MPMWRSSYPSTTISSSWSSSDRVGHHFDLLWSTSNGAGSSSASHSEDDADDVVQPPLHKASMLNRSPCIDLIKHRNGEDHPMAEQGTTSRSLPSMPLRDRPFSPFSGYYTQDDLYPSSEYDFFEGSAATDQPAQHPRSYLLFGEDDPYLYTYWNANCSCRKRAAAAARLEALQKQQQQQQQQQNASGSENTQSRRLSMVMVNKRPAPDTAEDLTVNNINPSKRFRLCEHHLFEPSKHSANMSYDESLEYF